jgi:transposase-like protein/IS1 family transposase
VIAFTEDVRRNCTHDRCKKIGFTKAGTQRFKCLDCGKVFVESTRTLAGMRIGTDNAEQIIRCLTEGVGIRSTARLCGVDQHTVMDLLVLVGQRCQMFLDETVVGVPVKDVQADELWSFVYCKDKTRKKLSLPVATFGDKYCFVGFERHNKLVLAWHVGARDYDDGQQFILKLARACGNHDFQITTDRWQPYKRLIPSNLRGADFGILIKVFAHGQDTGRYSPGQIIELKYKTITGQPDLDRVCTSHVERHNLSMRMQMRRFTRLTNCFSRKLKNHEAALGLYFATYNFVTRHSTLKTTPAVAAGLAKERWTVAELVERTAGDDLPNPPTEFDRFIDKLPDED